MASSAQYYTPAKTTDDDDEEEEHLTSSGRRPPPPTQYRDDPSNSYRDNPTPTTANKSNNDEENVPSIFDWGAPSSTSTATTTETAGSGGKSKKKKNNNHKGTATFQMDDPTTFDPDVEIPFTPISLHDDDTDEDSESDVSGAEQLRPHVNGLFKSTINRRSGGKRSHNGNLYGQIDNGGDDDEHQQQEGRLFVGGGWGRHGSTTDYRCGKLLTNGCSCERRYCCGRNPYGNNNFLCSSTGCFVVVFVMMTFLCGYLGYEAGLPVVTTTLDNANNITTTNNDGDDGFETTEHSSHTSVTTHGDLWLQWIKKEKDEIHLPHFHLNFTKRHAPIIYTDDNNNKQLSFPPMSQSELLTQSQHVFQSCSERSIATAAGRDACLSFCHGHYCCFEKDVEFGSCVTTANSYCFVYAACENVIMDFGFTNVENIEGIKKRPSNGGGSVDVDGLNRQDIDLLTATCSKDNVATLEGIRDCSAFCQHHLCCFSKDEGENCAEDHVEECEAYEPCRIIAEGPDGNNKGGVGGGSGITVTPEQVEKSVFDACYFGDDESKVTQGLVEKCHNICASRYCCFDSQTIVSSCRDTVGEEECNLYSLCEQMINDRGDEVKNFIELDKKEFTFGSSSSASNNNVNNAGMSSSGGTSYRPGSGGTFIDEAEFEETLSEVTAACDSNQPDDSWVSRCHALCADYLCCFSTDGTESNCKDVHGDDVCEAYSGCQVLQKLPSSSSTAESSPSSSSQQQQPQQQTNDQIAEQVQIDEMTETCVPKIRRDAGLRERCRKVCEPRDCCWKNGVGNCYQMNTDWCEEFSLCEILVV